MPPCFNVVIADTTCFIILDKIGELELLKSVFGKIITTPVIVSEFGQPLPDWVEIRAVQDIHLQESLQIDVDAGEASAIALAIELAPALLILHDLEARHLAKQLNLTHTGTLGIILRAKRTGHIKSVKPIIEKMKNTNFSISDNLYRHVLMEANEVD
jgi:predicted nucleic acid-binding protein